MRAQEPRSGPKSLLLEEAGEAAGAVARQAAVLLPAIRALAERLRARPPRFVVTAARGSSDHAALYVKYVVESRLGLATASAAPSVTTLYGRRLDLRDALFLAISQSGRSPDLVAQACAAREAGATTVALVNRADSPLAAAVETVLDIGAGPERAVAATKSFTCSVAAVLRLVAAWSNDRELEAALERLPSVLEKAAGGDWSVAVPFIEAADHLFTVGRGIGLSVAAEAALKLKETCGLHAEAYSGAELLHGPVTLLGPRFPALVFLPHDATEPGLSALVAGLRAQAIPVLTIGPGAALTAPDPVHPAVDPLVLLQALYLRLPDFAAARRRDPDSPPRLSKVTRTL